MRTTAKVALLVAAYGLVVGVAYAIVSSRGPGGLELAGVAMLLGLVPAGAGLGLYLWRHSRTPLPEDDSAATGEAAAGEVVGLFPTSSAWPATLAAGLAVVGLGLFFGVWLAAIGVFLCLFAILNLMRESRG